MTSQNGAVNSRARDLLLGAAHIERGRVLWWAALRIGIVTCALVALLALTGNRALALPAALGAVLVAVADAGDDVGRRWRTMLWATFWLMVAAFIGGIGGNYVILGVIGAAIFAFVGGFAGALGPRAALIGIVTLVIYAAFNGAPDSERTVLGQGLVVGLGGFIITLVTVLPHIVSRHAWMVALTPVPSIRERLRGKRNLDDMFLRHAIRLTILIVLTTVVSDLTPYPHDYWLPMTIAWVTRPDADGTTSKIVLRILGTIAGVLVCFVLVDVIHINEPGVAVACGLAAAVAVGMAAANYAVTVSGITVLVITLFTFDGDPVGETLIMRVVATVMAGVLAFLGFYIYPATRRGSSARVPA